MGGLGSFTPNFRNLEELLASFYGRTIVTLGHDSDFTIGTTATVLDSKRGLAPVQRLISNTGSTNFAISFNPAVTISTGVLLQAAGTFKLHWYYDGDLLYKPLYAISSAGGGTLHMVEQFLTGG